MAGIAIEMSKPVCYRANQLICEVDRELNKQIKIGIIASSTSN